MYLIPDTAPGCVVEKLNGIGIQNMSIVRSSPVGIGIV
jgi:hypothetical protein